jgi:hypothetical protein
VLVIPRIVHETPRHAPRFDVGGAFLATTGLVGIALGSSQASQSGWGSPATVAPFAASVVLFAAFVWLERRLTYPLVPFRIFANRSRSGGFASMFIVSAVQSSGFVFVALYVQKVLGYSPLQAGLVYLPATTLNTFMPAVWGRLITRVGGRILVTSGLLVTGIGLVNFSRLSTHSSYVTDILPSLFCTTLGSGLTFLPLTLVAVSRVAAADVGLTSGLLTTVQTIGGSLGLAVLSTIATSATQHHDPINGPAALVAGYSRAFEVAAAIALVGAVIAALTIGKVGRVSHEVTEIPITDVATP